MVLRAGDTRRRRGHVGWLEGGLFVAVERCRRSRGLGAAARGWMALVCVHVWL